MKKDMSAKAQRRRELAAKLKGANTEPVVEDKSSFGNALSWYSANTNLKDQKKYTLDYWKVENKDTHDALKKLPEWMFQTYGSVCRLKTREMYWADPENPSTFFERKTAELIEKSAKYTEKVDPVADPKPVAPVITIQDRIREKASEIAGEIEGEIDEFCDAGYPANYQLKTQLKGLAPQILKIIGDFYRPQQAEMEEALAGTCDQLNEGYAHMKKIDKKRYIAFMQHIIESCEQGIVSAKAQRKPRIRKAKPPAVVTKHVRYKVKDDELNLRSADKNKLVDSAEVWVYNTKYRKLIQYVAEDGQSMTVRGTTLVGFDIRKSQAKTLRKPELIKGADSMGKRALANLFKGITTKPGRPNGRLNEDSILLGIF